MEEAVCCSGHLSIIAALTLASLGSSDASVASRSPRFPRMYASRMPRKSIQTCENWCPKSGEKLTCVWP